jgi:multiple sugar transport system ATP-binding protein
MATITLRQVEKKFGDVHAVKPVDLTIQSGEFVVLLGPSGCGKTTTLRMISGLESVTSGDIFLDDRQVTWLHPSERNIAFVFQFFALYPHLTVRENIAFPLQAEGATRDTIEQRVKEVVDLLQIEHLLHMKPNKLSGGDKQRVALARSLVRRPAAFLMDEPLGALDADFRERMRAEIKRLHLNQNATTVYVTHDQIEAMAMGDRIVVMSNAEVQQVGTPAEVYYDPANLFVARFIGSPGMNLLYGRYSDGVIHLPGDNRYAAEQSGRSLTRVFPVQSQNGGPDNHYRVPEAWRPALEKQLSGEEVILGFRPEAAQVTSATEGQLKAEVYADDMHGAYSMLHLSLGSADMIVHVRASRDLKLPIGAPIQFDLDPEMVRFFDPKTERALSRGGQHG